MTISLKQINDDLISKTAIATQTSNGLISSTDKIKLDGIQASANNYVHPTTHPGTMITMNNGNTLEQNFSNAIAIQKRLTASGFQNTMLQSGFYTNTGDGILNSDGSLFKGGWWHIQVCYHFDNNGFGVQIATPLNDDGQGRYYRTSVGTSWYAWRKILDQRDYDSLFQYANDGKTNIANAITNKGISASSSETFSSLATKISQLSTGKRSANGVLNAYIDGEWSNDYMYTVDITGIGFTPSIIALQSTWMGNDYNYVKIPVYAPSGKGITGQFDNGTNNAIFIGNGTLTWKRFAGYYKYSASGVPSVNWFVIE